MHESSSYLRPDIHSQINRLLVDSAPSSSYQRIPLNVERVDNRGSHHCYDTGTKVVEDEIRIPLNKSVPGRLTINQEIQTDRLPRSHHHRRFVDYEIKPVFAEVETISFYHMTFEERMEHLKGLLTDGHAYKNVKHAYDPCIETAHYSRSRDCSRQPRSRSECSLKGSPLSSHHLPIETVTTVHHHRSVSRSRSPPPLTPTYSLNSPVNYQSSISPRTTLNKKSYLPDCPPRHHLIKSETTTIVDPVPIPAPRVHFHKIESTPITRIRTSSNASSKSSSSKLAHSTIELTSVLNDRTVVTGIPIKDSPPEAFSIHINNNNENSNGSGNKSKKSKNTMDRIKEEVQFLKRQIQGSKKSSQSSSSSSSSANSSPTSKHKPRKTASNGSEYYEYDNLNNNQENNGYDLGSSRAPTSPNTTPRTIHDRFQARRPYMTICTDVEVHSMPPTATSSQYYQSNNVNTYRPSSVEKGKWPNLRNDHHRSSSASLVPVIYTPEPYPCRKSNLRSSSDWSLSGTNKRDRCMDIDFLSYDKPRTRSASAFDAKITTVEPNIENVTQQMNTIGVTPKEVVNKTQTTKTLRPEDYLRHKNTGGDLIEVDFSQYEQGDYHRTSNQNNSSSYYKPHSPGVRFKSDVEVFSSKNSLNSAGYYQHQPTPHNYNYVYTKPLNTSDLIEKKSSFRSSSSGAKVLPVNVIDVDFSVYDESRRNYTTNNDRKVASVVKIKKPNIKPRRVKRNNKMSSSKLGYVVVNKTHEQQKSSSQITTEVMNSSNSPLNTSIASSLNVVDDLTLSRTIHTHHHVQMSSSLDDLNPRPKIRVAFRSPLRTTQSNTSLNRSLSRSTEIIDIKPREEGQSVDEDTPVMEISSVNPVIKPRAVKIKPQVNSDEPQPPRKTHSDTYVPQGAHKLNKIIDASMEKEVQKALNRVSKRRVRVPQILKQLDHVKGRDRRALEEELTLLMRKHKSDRRLLEMYGLYVVSSEEEEFWPRAPSQLSLPSQAPTTSTKSIIKPSGKPWESGYSSLEDCLSDKKPAGRGSNSKSNNSPPPKPTSPIPRVPRSDYEYELASSIKRLDTSGASSRRATPTVDAVPIESLAETGEIELAVNSVKRSTNSELRSSSSHSITRVTFNTATTSNNQQSNQSNTSNSGDNNNNNNSKSNEQYDKLWNSSSGGGDGNDENSGNEGNDSNDGDRGSRRTPPPVAKAASDSEEEEKVKYVEYENLAHLDLNNYEIFEDSAGEMNLIDLVTSERYIILPVNWRESDTSFYFAQEDVDPQRVGIFKERHNDRLYVLDEETNRKYYIVPKRAIKRLPSHRSPSDRILDSKQVVHLKSDEATSATQSELIVDYVEESELIGIDLDQLEVVELPNQNEIALVNSANRNQYWIILPTGWRLAENLPYIYEEDINLINLEFYIDPVTKRKFVIDDKTGQRYYIIPERRDSFKRFVIENKLNKPAVLKSNLKKPRDNSIEQLDSNKPSLPFSSSPKQVRIGDEILADYDREPSYSELRKMSRMRPIDTKFDPPAGALYLEDKDKIPDIEFTPPKSGGLAGLIPSGKAKPSNVTFQPVLPTSKQIRPRIEPIRPIVAAPRYVKPPTSESVVSAVVPAAAVAATSPSVINRTPLNGLPAGDQKPKWTSRPPPPARPLRVGGPQQPQRPGMPRPPQPQKRALNQKQQRDLLRQQQRQLRARQEAARKAMFAQKLPEVSQLWLHQLIINNKNRSKNFDRIREGLYAHYNLHNANGSTRRDDGSSRPWRSLTDLNDPTMYKENGKIYLDRDRLNDVQMYGYEKYNKNRRKVFGEVYDEEKKESNYTPPCVDPNISFGHEDEYPYFRGILTEDFRRERDLFVPLQLNPYFRALWPVPKYTLKQQILCTPSYLKDSWMRVLSQAPDGMQPSRIILLNDNEQVPFKKRSASVYAQFLYPNDGVLGVDKCYQLMLPDCGPTAPTRPRVLSPGKERVKRGQPKPELALREAPVFVYHQTGQAFYENLAQYLSARKPRISPSTARKLLQFENCQEFEDYLAAKITRDEAKRIAIESGDSLINVDTLKHNLVNLLDTEEAMKSREYYHFDCEYDPLRPPLDPASVEPRETVGNTKEYVVNGVRLKSTFIEFKDDDVVRRVDFKQLPTTLAKAVQDDVASLNNHHDSSNSSFDENVKITGSNSSTANNSLRVTSD